MIGKILMRILKEKNLSKTKIAEMTGLNVGHFTHIEKSHRTPSRKTLKIICDALKVPYQPLMYTYDKKITEEQVSYNAQNHLTYNKIIAVDSITSFIECPTKFPTTSMALQMPDDSMEGKIKSKELLFIELNTALNSRDIGIFDYNNEHIIRRFIVRKDCLILRADNKDYPEIILDYEDNFTIIGKVVGTENGISL